MVLATAFHPELTGDGRVHRLFCDMVRGPRPHRAAGMLPDAKSAAEGESQ
jgi:5'-phosphate synthase pdxT subunit